MIDLKNQEREIINLMFSQGISWLTAVRIRHKLSLAEVSKMLGKKRPTNGVKVEVGEKECSIEVFVIVEFGYPISEVAHEIQKSVLKAVSELSGLKVVEVNVYVQDVKIRTEGTSEEEEDTEEGL